ncbi:MAG TPA: hypothetical protein VMY87_04805 [Armatimonadota bacterium]|nr:hypothetical protein [Armatimonadota bacterium]
MQRLLHGLAPLCAGQAAADTLAQLDFTVTLACEDWRAKSSQRRHEVTIRWAGQALLGESAARDYVGSSKARAM